MNEQWIIDYLCEKYHPEAIILHGSRARGMEREDSDWDVYLLSGDKEISASERVDGVQIDLRILSAMINPEEVVQRFGPTFKDAKILYDTDGIGEQLIKDTQRLYDKGLQLTQREIENRKLRFERHLSRLRGATENIELFFFHTEFFRNIVRYWFELHDRWPEPPYISLQTIKKEDPDFFARLHIIATSDNNKKRYDAFVYLYNKLFNR